MKYSDKFTQALSFAAILHNGQLRKGTQIPYISHLLSVSVIVMRNGGDEEQAIAALLHDSVEDQGGINLLSDIESKFGARVARILSNAPIRLKNRNRLGIKGKKHMWQRLPIRAMTPF